MAAADEAERIGLVDDAAALDDGGGLAAGVYQVGIGVIPGRGGAAADNAYLRLEPELNALGQVVGAHQGNAYTEVNKVPILEELSAARRYQSTSSQCHITYLLRRLSP